MLPLPVTAISPLPLAPRNPQLISTGRRANTFFTTSQHWKTYDFFARQKINTFRSSRPAVLELAARYRELVHEIETSTPATASEESERLLFVEMCEICLWGNATDLSLLTSITYEDIQKLQGAEARKASEANILANDTGKAFDLLKRAKAEGKAERRVDIVLDNAGFELYVDLILAGYLLSSGLATTIVLHPKSIPWFVSDVLPSDFAHMLSTLANPRPFYETPSADEELQGKTPEPLAESDAENLAFLFGQWSRFHAEGQVILRPNRFWTAPGSFWEIPAEKDLHEDLKGSELVIFKGDLNYRKLTADVSFPIFCPSLPFVSVVQRLWWGVCGTNGCRPRGTPPRRSPSPSARWAPGRASTCCR